MLRSHALSGLLLLAGCAHTHPDDLQYEAVMADATAPREMMGLSIRDIHQQAVEIPDPRGRHVIVELIRSADW